MENHYRFISTCSIVGGTTISADLGFSTPIADPLDHLETQISDLQIRARQYWSGASSGEELLEIVTTGLVTIVETEAL